MVVAVILCSLVLTLAAAAADGNVTMSIKSPLQLNGKQLAPGDYKIRWSGNGGDLKVSFLVGNKEVLTTTAKLVERTAASPYTSTMVVENNLKEIRLANKKAVIVVAN